MKIRATIVSLIAAIGLLAAACTCRAQEANPAQPPTTPIEDIRQIKDPLALEYLNQKIMTACSLEMFEFVTAFYEQRIDTRNMLEKATIAHDRTSWETNSKIVERVYNQEQINYDLNREFAMAEARATKVAATYTPFRFRSLSDGSKIFFQDGLVVEITNEASTDEFGNTSRKHMYNFSYDSERRMTGYEAEITDHMGNTVHTRMDCQYTGDSVWWGSDESGHANKHYSHYSVSETDHTGRTISTEWNAGTYNDKYLLDYTEKITDSVYGSKFVHRYNIQYRDPRTVTGYDEEGLDYHDPDDLTEGMTVNYRIHRENVIYNEKGQIASYDETRWDAPANGNGTEPLDEWVKTTTHAEFAYWDAPDRYGRDAGQEPDRLKRSEITTTVERPDGSSRTETSTVDYAYDEITGNVISASGHTEFSGQEADWYQYTDKDGNFLRYDEITGKYYDKEGTEVAADQVTKTLKEGHRYDGSAELTYDIIYGRPYVTGSDSTTNMYDEEGTLYLKQTSHSTNTYELRNNIVRLITSTDESKSVDPEDAENCSAETTTTTYTYDAKGNLEKVSGKGEGSGLKYDRDSKLWLEQDEYNIYVFYTVKLGRAEVAFSYQGPLTLTGNETYDEVKKKIEDYRAAQEKKAQEEKKS